MSGLHARLLAELDAFDRLLVHPVRFNNALRVAVELHAPVPCQQLAPCGARHEHITCPRCVGAITWPCSTIQAIARELGVETGDDRG